jgi:hypothetical protein
MTTTTFTVNVTDLASVNVELIATKDPTGMRTDMYNIYIRKVILMTTLEDGGEREYNLLALHPSETDYLSGAYTPVMHEIPISNDSPNIGFDPMDSTMVDEGSRKDFSGTYTYYDVNNIDNEDFIIATFEATGPEASFPYKFALQTKNDANSVFLPVTDTHSSTEYSIEYPENSGENKTIAIKTVTPDDLFLKGHLYPVLYYSKAYQSEQGLPTEVLIGGITFKDTGIVETTNLFKDTVGNASPETDFTLYVVNEDADSITAGLQTSVSVTAKINVSENLLDLDLMKQPYSDVPDPKPSHNTSYNTIRGISTKFYGKVSWPVDRTVAVKSITIGKDIVLIIGESGKNYNSFTYKGTTFTLITKEFGGSLNVCLDVLTSLLTPSGETTLQTIDIYPLMDGSKIEDETPVLVPPPIQIP